VRETRERPELMRPADGALLGHRHQLVPVQEHLHGGEVRELGHAATQFLEGVHAAEGMRSDVQGVGSAALPRHRFKATR
jgi:hypothetical protein